MSSIESEFTPPSNPLIRRSRDRGKDQLARSRLDLLPFEETLRLEDGGASNCKMIGHCSIENYNFSGKTIIFQGRFYLISAVSMEIPKQFGIEIAIRCSSRHLSGASPHECGRCAPPPDDVRQHRVVVEHGRSLITKQLAEPGHTWYEYFATM